MIPDKSDDAEIEAFWSEYYPKLKRAIAYRVNNIRHPVADESEIALSAINSFIERANDGRLEPVDNSKSLWKLLKTIAIRKANDRRKSLLAKKRGGGRATIGQSDGIDDESSSDPVQAIPDAGPNPQADEDISDLFNYLLQESSDQRIQDVILLRLQGASITTIAEGLEISTKTVRRTLQGIEKHWTESLLGEQSS